MMLWVWRVLNKRPKQILQLNLHISMCLRQQKKLLDQKAHNWTMCDS
jgi:hypothetical protein